VVCRRRAQHLRRRRRWYDLDLLPPAFQPALASLLGQLAEACRRPCRRALPPAGLGTAAPSPWQGVSMWPGAHDISQARPELGHATNAAAFIGRREMSRGLFLDRRVFLISYDPLRDDEGTIVENILLAAGPVGAGISARILFFDGR
jgi:uncharacterized protein YbcC (UPF0753/DUF2309 family)